MIESRVKIATDGLDRFFEMKNLQGFVSVLIMIAGILPLAKLMDYVDSKTNHALGDYIQRIYLKGNIYKKYQSK